MKKLILAAAALASVLAPAMASAQVQRAVATGGEAQLIQIDDRRGDRREWRRERREDRREHRRDRREDRREWRDDRRNYRQGYRHGYAQAPRYYHAPGYYQAPRYYAPPPSYGYYRPGYSHHQPRFYRGAVLPYEYRRYVVRDYYNYGWAPPPPGYAYYRADSGEILLAAIATGVILSIIAGGF